MKMNEQDRAIQLAEVCDEISAYVDGASSGEAFYSKLDKLANKMTKAVNAYRKVRREYKQDRRNQGEI